VRTAKRPSHRFVFVRTRIARFAGSDAIVAPVRGESRRLRGVGRGFQAIRMTMTYRVPGFAQHARCMFVESAHHLLPVRAILRTIPENPHLASRRSSPSMNRAGGRAASGWCRLSRRAAGGGDGNGAPRAGVFRGA
jgi:hypothetical protein